MLEALQNKLPDLDVRTDSQSLESYGRDWTTTHIPQPLAIAFPRRAQQVQDLVRFANDHHLSLVPSGGRTGLSAGAVATNGELVVSLEKMNEIINFEEREQLLTVQAGVVTQKIQDYAADLGLYYPVDFASKGSSQIGGNVATNAGGIKVLRYGLTRQWVRGLKVVTGRGELLDLNRGLMKNATGYDLRHLFIGSEGTLGIIVEVTLALAPQPKPQSVMVLGTPSMDAVMKVLSQFRSELQLSAFEFFSDSAMEQTAAHAGLTRPFETPANFYCLIEFDNDGGAEEVALGAFEACVEAGWVEDGVMSQSEAQRQSLWRLREDISETIARHKPYKNDISVNVAQVPQLLSQLNEVVSSSYPDFTIVWYGHIGDGNLHLNILKPHTLEVSEFTTACESVNTRVFDIVQQLGGSVSAEHGVGLLKKPYLGYTRSPEELAYMAELKQVFDPNGIMNPGKLVDLPGS